MSKVGKSENKSLTKVRMFELAKTGLFNNEKTGEPSPAKLASQLLDEFPEIKVSKDRLAERIRAQLKKAKLNEEQEIIDNPIEAFAREKGIDPSLIKSAWYKDSASGMSLNVKGSHTDEEFDVDLFIDGIASAMEKKSPKVKLAKTKDEGHLLVISFSDLHLGKRSVHNDYSIETAVKEAFESIEGILQKASGFPTREILFLTGHDLIHVDGKSTTTRGTPQDVSTSWDEMVEQAIELQIRILDRLMEVAPVKVIHNNGNHDRFTGIMVSKVLRAWYHNNPNIEFDISMQDRKYHKFGNVLIGAAHGDSAREALLPQLMAHESPDWSSTNKRYFLLGHLHHRINKMQQLSKDMVGVNITYTRSLSPTDQWHSDSGYLSTFAALEAFIYHPDEGQVAHLIHHRK